MMGASAFSSDRSRPIWVDIAISAPARSIEAQAMSTSRLRITSRIEMWFTSTSYIESSSESGSMPWLMVRFACGSRSTQSTRCPFSLNATARLSVVVVLATPPFWLVKATISAVPEVGSGRRSAGSGGGCCWVTVSVGLRSKIPMCRAYSYEAGRFLQMPALIDKRLIFVAGKGGVGRTTVAAALGLAAAARGRRTIVCEVARQERVSRAFKREGVGFHETELATNLFAISIDPQQSLEEFLSDQVGSRRVAGLLFHNRLFEYLAAATPGLRELATIGKVWELAQLERRTRHGPPYDLVIVDLQATGHGLGALRTARTFGDVAHVGPVRRRADMIDSLIRDSAQTGVLAVALPEEMPVTETIEFAGALHDQMGLELELTVMNAMLPERFGG